MATQSWHTSSLSPQSSPAKQQQLRLQLLQLERERLKQRQQEIRRQQEIMLRNNSNSELAMDPFLSSLTDHSRQESADSGLGKLIFFYINYLFPSTLTFTFYRDEFDVFDATYARRLLIKHGR